MQIRLLDILADPDTKTWPLKLVTFEKITTEREITAPPYEETGLYCRFYCALHDIFFVKEKGGKEVRIPKEEWAKQINSKECKTCIKEEIVEGVLISQRKDRKQWFPIVDEIPIMFPDELRDKSIDNSFTAKHAKKLKELGLNL